MGFKQPCFIKKNTPELRKKLEDIGHVRYPYEFADWDDDGKDRKYIIIDIMYYTYNTEPIGKPKKKDVDFVDCGDNEELFLALAGLRDDNDVNQLFYYEGKLVVCVQDFSSTLNIYNDKFYKVKLFDNKNILFEVPFKKLRKCTVEEIIERFKK